jgi:predicted Ser/Thr protein kinase
MEEEKKYFVPQIERLRQEIFSSDKSDIEILNSARLGTDDYDFESVKIINKGGQGVVFEVKSKIDGKIYAAKRL